MVHLMGRCYLQLEFLLTKAVWESAASFNYGFVFSSNNSVQTKQMLSRHNSSSVPATCQVPTLRCPHQKSNLWEWYLCGTWSSPSPYPGAKNITLTVQQLIGEPGATEKKHKWRKGYQAKIWGWQQQFQFFSIPGTHHGYLLIK